MVCFEVFVDEINGPPKFGEDKDNSMIEARAYNRRLFIWMRRSLPLQQRVMYDELVRAILSRSLTAWSGQPGISIADLAQLVREGWAIKITPRSATTG